MIHASQIGKLEKDSIDLLHFQKIQNCSFEEGRIEENAQCQYTTSSFLPSISM